MALTFKDNKPIKQIAINIPLNFGHMTSHWGMFLRKYRLQLDGLFHSRFLLFLQFEVRVSDDT